MIDFIKFYKLRKSKNKGATYKEGSNYNKGATYNKGAIYNKGATYKEYKVNKKTIYNPKTLGLIAFLFLLILIPILSLCAPVGKGNQKVNFNIVQGMGAGRIAQELKKEGLIVSPSFFKIYLYLTSNIAHLQKGSYELDDGMWMPFIIHKLTTGKVKLNVLTIPEGWNNRQIADYLLEKGLVKNRLEFLEITKDKAILSKYKIPSESTEGYLYPETYNIPFNYTAYQFHLLLLESFFDNLKKSNFKAKNNKELHEKIILASIVEREARKPEERAVIARVFLNRLQRNIKLESCATVQYLFDKSHPKLYIQDLYIASPYNTYMHKGLPPAPISNPGKAAMLAAFYPQKNDLLFFVVKPDGSHHFSKTYKEHLEAKKVYIDSDLVQSNTTQ